MNFDPDSYTITIRRENVDGDFLYVGRVAEFQNITAYEETFEDARTVLLDAITTLKTLAEEEGAAFPLPNVSLPEEYSGRPSIRLPKSLHAKVARLAEEEGVSLNTCLVSAVAMYAGEAQGLSWAAKEMKKNMSAVYFMVTRATTKLVSSSDSLQRRLPEKDTHWRPLFIKTPLLEVTNDG